MCGGRLSGAERSRRSHAGEGARGGRSRPTGGAPGAAERGARPVRSGAARVTAE